jgi:hypothetical protein
MEDTIDISDLDEAAVIAALHNGTRALGMGMLHDICRDISPDEVREELPEYRDRNGGLRLDYFHGRPLKVDIANGKLFGEWLYDRDAGEGRCREVLAKLRASKAA